MNKIIIIFVFFLFTKSTFGQQDAQFSQYMFNGIYINPAYAGYKEQLNLHAFYRSQWTGFPGSPKTMSLAVDAIANDGNVGIALQVSSDRLGAQSSQSIYGNYAYRIRMNEDGSSRLTFGLGLGAVQYGIDGAKLNPNDFEFDQPIGMQNSILPDARAGVYFANNRFYAGFSADNLVAQYININRFAYIAQPKPHYYLTAGMLIPISQDILLKPSFLVKDDMAGPTSLDVNAFILFSDKIWLGGAYRTGVKIYDKKHLQHNLSQLNSAVLAVQLFPTTTLRLGYAYDFSIGALRGQSGSTHELSLGYFFKRRDIRMRTPRFF